VAGILDSMKTDLEKGKEIVKKDVRFIGRMGVMHENIAMAVAEGIALGRKDVAGTLDSMETDLNKAREIVRKHVRFIGRMGMMHENIAIAVADGIALGRKEGIAMAAEATPRLKGEKVPKHLDARRYLTNAHRTP
jgi:hypothetical protein